MRKLIDFAGFFKKEEISRRSGISIFSSAFLHARMYACMHFHFDFAHFSSIFHSSCHEPGGAYNCPALLLSFSLFFYKDILDAIFSPTETTRLHL